MPRPTELRTTSTEIEVAMTDRIARVGWIVDAQNDFLLPPERSGRLYVHDLFDGGKDAGATQCTPALIRAARWMEAECDAIVYTGDWHSYDDAEIDTVA